METNWFDKAVEEINKLSDEQKQQFKEWSEKMCKQMETSRYAHHLRYDRAFKREAQCEVYGIGEYHVYMWLHADGTPFYVGSGKGDRWKNACSRNERFFEETKKLDTWVCKLIDGLTLEESREAEFCLSHYLTYNGYKLANHDNNFLFCVGKKQEDRRVGKFVRLMGKTYNNKTVELAKSKIKPCELPYDLVQVREEYILNFGEPA